MADMLAAEQVAPQLDPEAYSGLVQALIRRRDDAVAARKSSGIESDWIEDYEYTQGIDDANRAFVRSWVASVKRGQPTQQQPEGARSVVFVNITAPYCASASARVGDILLPTDDRCWSIQPTPIAELDPQTTLLLAQSGINWAQEQAQIQADAEAKAKLMADAIEDKLAEANWHGVIREVIEDAATLGTGIIKGPIPSKRTAKKWRVVEGQASLEIIEEIVPSCERVDPWNFYPAKDCGNDIHNGRDVWERSYSTAKQLQDLRDLPGYNAEAVNECLKEGPKQIVAREAGDGTYIPLAHTYEIWTSYARVTAKEAGSGGLQVDDDTTMVDVMAVLCNDRLIKLSLNALETGEYPYDVLAWQKRPGVPWGMGVARQIRTPQRILNAATRAMMDNAGMTAAPQIVLGNGVYPADGKYEIRGRKTWRAEPEVVDVRAAFFAFVPPSYQQEFRAIIEFALEMAERTTGMPALLMGQQTNIQQGAKTLGGMQLLQNNASGPLRRLCKRFDDYITEPHIKRWYNWMLQFDPREDIKGDFQVDARGSSALVQRDSARQFFYAALNVAPNPAYGINPSKLFKELCRAEMIDPELIQYTEQEMAQMQAPQPNPVDEAKAALLQAQAAQTAADTVLKRIESLFSATQTANLIAATPQIAAAADATARSAGFQDQDAPPAISPVPPGAEPVPVPQNTHPTFPANPQSADDGMMQGVEGGQ